MSFSLFDEQKLRALDDHKDEDFLWISTGFAKMQ